MSINKRPFFKIGSTSLSIDLFIYPSKTRFKVGVLKLSVEDRELKFNTKEPTNIGEEHYTVKGVKMKVKHSLSEIDLWSDHLKVEIESTNQNLDAILIITNLENGNTKNIDVKVINKTN